MIKPMLATGRAGIIPSMDNLTAWAAGFIDGEGHVGIHRIRREGKLARLNPRVIVGQTHRDPLDRLHDLFGGSVNTRKQTADRRTFWIWEPAGAKRTHAVLTATLPLLTIKREEALVVVLLCERIMGWRQGCRLTDEEIDIRDQLAKDLALVKTGSRGAVPPKGGRW